MHSCITGNLQSSKHILGPFGESCSSRSCFRASQRQFHCSLRPCRRPGIAVSASSQSSSSANSPGADKLPEPVPALESASISMTSLVSRPSFVLAAAVTFSIIAFDVNSPNSLHLLPQSIDQPAHAWVKANLPVPVKNLVAEKLVSDLFITGGIGGWVLAGAAGIGKDRWNGVKRLVIALLMYYFGAGSIRHGDPFVVDQLKTYFARVRPSDILNTYAFPSGHTTAATFIMGTLLCVLLPPLTIDNDSNKNSRLQTIATSAALPLWVLAILTTATGRVLGDAHWVSDTMAGACLGACLVSVTTVLCSRLASGQKQ